MRRTMQVIRGGSSLRNRSKKLRDAELVGRLVDMTHLKRSGRSGGILSLWVFWKARVSDSPTGVWLRFTRSNRIPRTGSRSSDSTSQLMRTFLFF